MTRVGVAIIDYPSLIRTLIRFDIQPERRAVPLRGLEPHATPHLSHDLPSNGEAEACAATASGVGAVSLGELFEYPGLEGFGYACAIVRDFDAKKTVVKVCEYCLLYTSDAADE